jgi:hypothetical protein
MINSSGAAFESCGTIRQNVLSRVPRCNPGGSLKGEVAAVCDLAYWDREAPDHFQDSD